ncbi:MAG: DNA polymerase, partial [Alcaligenaceae bacterium]
MREHRHEVAGTPVVIRVVENEDDLDGFRDFIRSNLRGLGVDSETTGLDIYSDTFSLRLAQFGTDKEAWVVPAEKGERFREDIRMALRGLQKMTLHNAAYDLQVFDRTLDVPMEELWPKVTDTQILAHLVDPRGREEGGIGNKLEELTKHYIDPEVAENVKTLMKDLAREYKTTKAKIWKLVDIDNPRYELYAGMDPILACRMEQKLRPKVPGPSAHLIPYEHQIAEVCSTMSRTGFLLDVEYSEKLSERLLEERDHWNAIAKTFGCENVNSTEQVADVIEARGHKIKGRTETGKRKVDKVLLDQMVAQEDEFAKAVVEAKRAGKWRKTWVETFLSQRDAQDRCHANINPLRARTARMSITGIPAQTLPSGDWMVRRCFIADEGHLMSSVDYQAQELRVLAALSGDPTMRKAFLEGADLHQMTADSAAVNRKVGKMANFLVVYGGG